MFHLLVKARFVFWGRRTSGRHLEGAEVHPQVLVVAYLLQVLG